MRGMDLQTGGILEGIDYLRQSIQIILTTPKGSRLILKDFGSSLFELVDSGSKDLSAYALAVRRALKDLEEFNLTRVNFVPGSAAGRVELEIVGEYLPTSELVRTRVLL